MSKLRQANVLVIMSDEHTRSVMGAHGNSQVKTPALDQLANSGDRFENTYTPSPICISARASSATGAQVFEHRSNAFDDQAEMVTKLGGLHAIQIYRVLTIPR